MHESRSPQIGKKSDEEKETGRVNYDLVRSWLSICEIEHTNLCRSTPAQLELFLVDVSTCCIIKAPKDCQYLALSYVCGKTLPNLEGLTPETWRQDLGTSHERLPAVVPRTIENAMQLSGSSITNTFGSMPIVSVNMMLRNGRISFATWIKSTRALILLSLHCPETTQMQDLQE